MQAASSTVVNASPTQVWAVLADHAGMSSWGPGLKATVDKPGAGDPNGVGAVRRIAAPGPMPAIVEEITRFDADSALGYKAISGVPFKGYRGLVELSPVDKGTRIDWTLSADQRVPIAEQAAIKAVSATLLRLLVRAVNRAQG